MFTKLFSVLLSLFIMLQTFLPASLGAKGDGGMEEAELSSVEDYIAYAREFGAPSMDTATFLNALRPLGAAHRLLSGRLFAEENEAFVDVTFDEQISEFTGYIAENTGLDIEDFIGVMPRLETPLGRAVARGLNLDTSSVRQKIYAVGDKAREEGYSSLATMLYVFAMFFTVAEQVYIYGVPREENPDEITVLMDVTYRDGNTETVDPDIVINTKTGHAYNVNGTGLAGSGFEMDIYDLTLYTVVNCWQRKFGFTVLYDLHSDTDPVFNYMTRRFRFEYGGKNWMLQIWKGNYALVTNGAEIGIYNHTPGAIGTYYGAAADDEMLTFGMEVLHGDTLLVQKGPETNWWLTAFKLSRNIYPPETLTLRFTVTFPDAEMLGAFTDAVANHIARDVTCAVDGLTVTCVWAAM